MNGMVLNAAQGRPVPDAVVKLNTAPPDAVVEYETSTDGFGMFELRGVTPGTYALTVEHPGFAPHATNLVAVAGITNRVIRLAPVDGKEVFDLYVQAFCLATQAPLVAGSMTVEYWAPDGVYTGAPDQVFTAPLDPSGAGVLTGLLDGFYRLRVARSGWETLSYAPPPGGGSIVVGDKVRLSKSHFASVFLRPVKTNLKVEVRGFDPVRNLPDQPLKGMTVHLTGVDLLDDNLELVPTIAGLSGDDGSFTFGALAPIRWRVKVARLGYEPTDVLVWPNADGTLPDQMIGMALEPTKLKVMARSAYKTSQSVAGAKIKLEGLRESNTEGIARESSAAPDGGEWSASALFENLLPGRYWARIEQQTTISNLPAASGPIFSPTAFDVSFFPLETFADADLGVTGELKVKLKAVPAKVRGRLFATEELANVEQVLNSNEPHRIFHSMAHPGITFMEHKVVSLIEEGENQVVVDTDESGHFTALVPPGILGIQIPTLATHTGHHLEAGTVSEGFGLFPRGWPYPDIWPYATHESGRHGAGLIFSSGEETHMNLYVHRNHVNLCGAILNPSSDPFRELVLSVSPDGNDVVTTKYNHFHDTQAEVTVTGPVTRRARVLRSGSYLARDLVPGTYTLELNHPEYTTPTRSVTIAPWTPPGVLPVVAPNDPTHWFPGLTHSRLTLNLQPTWKAQGLIWITRRTYVTPPDGPPYYQTGSAGYPEFFETSGVPGRLFTYIGSVPVPGWTVYFRHGDGWFAQSGVGEAMLDAYEGGPLDNTSPSNFPSRYHGYTVDLRAYSRHDRHVEIPGVTVAFASGESRAAGGVVNLSGAPDVASAVHAGGQWTLRRSATEVTVIDPGVRLVSVNVFMDRSMTFTGLVSSVDGPVPQASVVFRNRYGNRVGGATTREDGTYSAFAITPQVLYAEVQRRGFITRRIRLPDPDPDNPDVRVDLTVEKVPAPVITDFTMNRFGLFLPGVSRSGDATGFNPQNSAEKLTMTWKGEAEAARFRVTLPGFLQANEQPGPDEVADVNDKVAEMWLIDRRAFTNAFINDLNQANFQVNNAPVALDYIEVIRWLTDVTSGRRDGEPFYVVHQLQKPQPGGPRQRVEGQLNLWELPSGVFRPMLLAISEAGGVAVKDYTPPPAGNGSEELLQGLGLSKWAANILDAVGVAANTPGWETDGHANYDGRFMKVGTFTAKTEGRIGLDPITAGPEDNAYLTYKYALSVEMPFGEGAPGSGLTGIGPRFLGLKLKGGTGEFEVSGRDKKAALAVVVGTAPPEEFEERDRDYRPVVSEGANDTSNKFEVDTEVSGKVAFIEVLDADWQGRNRVASFGMGLEAQGKVDMAAQFNATPVVSKFPYVGPVLLAADKSRAFTIYAVIEGTLGAKFTWESQTTFPEPGATVVGPAPPRWNILGGTTTSSEVKIFVRVAGGLRLSALNGAVSGTALFQLGAPTDTPDVDGVVFTVNPLIGQGHLFSKIEGAASFILRLEVELWTFKAGKQMQWDIGRFVIDRGSEPSFELAPLNITHSIISPTTSLPQVFTARGSNLIENFYAAGALDLSRGANPLFVFTGIDPAGNMTVMASLGSPSGWTAPTALATAGGILSVAALGLPDGGQLVAWTEIDASALGNPFPRSTIKSAVWDASQTSWSAPGALVAGEEAMFDLRLVQAGEKELLLYQAAAEGPQGPKSVRFAVRDQGQWSTPSTVLAASPLQSMALAGSTSGAALALVTAKSGELQSFLWNGLDWATATAPTTNAGRGVAVQFENEHEAVAAWFTTDHELRAGRFHAGTGVWTPLAIVAPSAFGTECQLAILGSGGNTLYLVTWIAGADRSSVYYAMLERSGAVRVPPTEITVGSGGEYRRLKVRPGSGTHAQIMASYTTGADTVVREFAVGLPTEEDCDGDGITDALAIAMGAASDCNGNGRPDACDIRLGISQDRDHNGVPDECELAPADDCNRNGVSDRYELVLGIGDENGNGVLDACEGLIAVKEVQMPLDVPERFYRARSLQIRSRSPDTIEFQFEGLLEQADSVTGPWTRVE